jgi:hypothetical protein
MEDEVIYKLRLEMKRTLRKESQICYILVLARKLLEHEPTMRPNFATLEFFCDWALHTKLTKHHAGVLLQEFDRQVPEMLQGIHDNLTFKSAKVFKTAEFIVQLMALLIKHNITFPRDTSWAVRFMNLYLNMICNCPVTYDQRQIELRHIDKLMVTKHPDDETKFKWELTIKGQPVYSWDVEFPIKGA